jgi:tetratricopeptide (TPR) repeat protein
MRIAPILALLAGMLTWGASVAQSDALAAARAALRGGDPAAAAAAVERHLAANPKDPRGRFLKGVILTEQGQTNEAFDVFLALTQDHPEFPEPYNNLAVIYAGRGEHERARELLETAIRVNPDYATAYENLGDIYAQLAKRAYESAAKLDLANRGARAKLGLARDLMKYSPHPRPADAAAAPPPRRN